MSELNSVFGMFGRRGSLRAAQCLAGVAAALALAACGGGSGTKHTTTSGPAAPGSSTPAPATTGGSAPERFRQTLIDRSGFTAQQASCIVKIVLAKIGRAEFDRLYGKGNTPTRVQQVILKANAKCAPRGAGH
jgi:ABC-type phosphate transport system substrate-binding protein